MITQALKAFAHLGDLQRGINMHHTISSRINNDSYIFASLIHFYNHIKNNQAYKAMDLSNEIDKPNDVIIILLFNTCAQLGTTEASNLAKRVSKTIPQLFYSNLHLLTSLLDALMKCAQLLFDRSTRKALSMYGATMNGYNKDKNPSKTLNLFYQMKMDGIEPNFYLDFC
ncbi:unnamed protein product [Adineta steineri]|uniref:Pentatricopeptide repeat-containing protein n=1 Tax=Adineta steineri TaxID=433720 RepID=A0A814M092_9BILA|nr:unnamed protein product [Adineta steineri]CAF1071252.1 unnamed protein product [Adineta steineri]